MLSTCCFVYDCRQRNAWPFFSKSSKSLRLYSRCLFKFGVFLTSTSSVDVMDNRSKTDHLNFRTFLHFAITLPFFWVDCLRIRDAKRAVKKICAIGRSSCLAKSRIVFEALTSEQVLCNELRDVWDLFPIWRTFYPNEKKMKWQVLNRRKKFQKIAQFTELIDRWRQGVLQLVEMSRSVNF